MIVVAITSYGLLLIPTGTCLLCDHQHECLSEKAAMLQLMLMFADSFGIGPGGM